MINVENKRQEHMVLLRKSVAWIIGLLVLCVVILSAYYIVAELDHDCSGEDCPICECVQNCENILTQVSDGLNVLLVTILPILFVTFLVSLYSYRFLSETLVSLKIQLNN